MASRKLRMLCAGGDKTLAEWNTETVSPERLREIEAEFTAKMKQGFFATDISQSRNTLTRTFDPNADTLLIPQVKDN